MALACAYLRCHRLNETWRLRRIRWNTFISTVFFTVSICDSSVQALSLRRRVCIARASQRRCLQPFYPSRYTATKREFSSRATPVSLLLTSRPRCRQERSHLLPVICMRISFNVQSREDQQTQRSDLDCIPSRSLKVIKSLSWLERTP